ncbi:MAG TPA: Hsp20/alpha crystallin family protein [Bacteroidaceae bacterium]|nr:Hsp20/alpha crystallin family protein [Bacteroidaceae bacterium]
MVLAKRNQNYGQNWLPSLFNDFFNDEWFVNRSAVAAPAMNVIENSKAYDIEFAIPGLKKEDINLQIDCDNILSISMIKKDNKEEKDKPNYLRREFSYQKVNQSYILPEDISRDKISAKVDNGVLYINVPKLKAEDKKNEVQSISID